MGTILLVTGILFVIASIVVFIIYLTMGKAAGKRLVKDLKEEY